jgi:DegV family protein with EDD domain
MLKIVSDSSCDRLDTKDFRFDFDIAPLIVSIGDKNYIDDMDLNRLEMLEAMENFKGATMSACPSPNTWVEKVGDLDKYDEIIFVSISGSLSGSYNSANIAKEMILETHPNTKIYVLDSLSASCNLIMLIDKINDFVGDGLTFEEICENIEKYKDTIELDFLLFSVENLVKSGRLNKIVGFAANKLGIAMIGERTKDGKIAPKTKARGKAKGLSLLNNVIMENNYKGGKMIISHCFNLADAMFIKNKVLETYPNVEIKIVEMSGLCCYYAERNGLIVAYETN